MHRRFFSRWVPGAALAAIMSISSTVAAAQSTTTSACTTGDLTACVQVSLTTQTAVGGSTLLFAVQNLGLYGSLELASRPSIVWSLLFTTGRDAAALIETPTTPTGSTVIDASAWTFADAGDLWQLTYPSWEDQDFTTKGIGSAVDFTGTARDAFDQPWQQIGTTDQNNAISFSVFVPYAVDGTNFEWFRIEGLEASAFLNTNGRTTVGPNGSCSLDEPCGEVPRTDVPEPASVALLSVGMLFVVARARRSRVKAAELS